MVHEGLVELHETSRACRHWLQLDTTTNTNYQR